MVFQRDVIYLWCSKSIHGILGKLIEKSIEKGLMLSALATVLTTVSILGILLVEAIDFFRDVSIFDFLTDTQWTPLFDDKHFGILPLLSGTFITSLVAIVLALPLGLSIAIFLNEYAHKNTRKIFIFLRFSF